MRARLEHLRWLLLVETQPIRCITCGRNGRYFFHWHRSHMIAAR